MLIALKLKAAALGVAVAAPMMAATMSPAPGPAVEGAATLPASSFSYRAAGDFSRGGTPVAAPLRRVRHDGGIAVMNAQVTAAEYARCMDEGACPKAAMPPGSREVAMVGVSWHDASAYADWMTARTGRVHRLPTDEEWTLAAAEKARDEALPLVDPSDPAQAWLARYDAEASRDRPAETAPQATGFFGVNSRGIADLGGNVWEWTSSCFLRISIEGEAERVTNTNCGVRVVEGAHRTYMTDFIRDPKAGGCAAGVPPANLGFRLVVETAKPSLLARIAMGAGRLGARI